MPWVKSVAKKLGMFATSSEWDPKFKEGKSTSQIAEEIKAEGYDGVSIDEEVVVFNPEKVSFSDDTSGDKKDLGEALEWVAARNKGLDMSKEVRMQRARDMGFDIDAVWYHGTYADFREFDPNFGRHSERGLGIHLGTIDQADARIYEPKLTDYSRPKNIIPVIIKADNPLRLQDLGTWSPEDLQDALKQAGIKVKGKPSHENNVKSLERAGYDSIIYTNEVEAKHSAGDSVIVLDPSNIRSVNAAFDPDNKFSSNISGGVGVREALGVAGVGAISAFNDAQAQDAYGDNYDIRNFPILEQQGYWEPKGDETVDSRLRRELDYAASKKAYSRWQFEQANTSIAGEVQATDELKETAEKYKETRQQSKQQRVEYEEGLKTGQVFQGSVERPEEARPWDLKRKEHGGALDRRENNVDEGKQYSLEGLPKDVQRRLKGRVGEQTEFGSDEAFLELAQNDDGVGGPEVSVPEGLSMAGDADNEQVLIEQKLADQNKPSNWIPNNPISPAVLQFNADKEAKSPPEITNEKPSGAEIWGAAFRRENVIGSILQTGGQIGDIGTFSPYRDETYLEGYEEYADRFQNAFTKTDADRIKRRIDQEKSDLKIIELGGWNGIGASLVAGTLDPTIFIPVGGQVKKGDSLLRLTRLGVQSATLGAVASEGLLQTTQLTRTGEESAYAIGGAAVLGGLLGAGSKVFLGSTEGKVLTAKFEDEMTIKGDEDPMLSYEQSDTKAMQSAGSAAVEETATIEGEALAPSAGLAEAGGKIGLNPILRLARSPSAKAQQVSSQLMENGMFLGRNTEGKSSPLAAETAMREWQGYEAKSLNAYNKTFKEMNKNTEGMTKTQFAERVGRALRRGDKDELGDEYVTKAAQQWRSTLDRMKKEAIELGLLPEDVKVETADSYFHRMWNQKALKANSQAFKQMSAKWISDQFDMIMSKAYKIDVDVFKTGAKLGPEDAKIVEMATELQDILDVEGNFLSYADIIANDIYQTLIGINSKTLPSGLKIVPNARGPLAERTFHIPDLYETNFAKVEDFLVDDVEEVMSRYMRVMSADIEITRSFGDRDMEGAIKSINDDFDKLVSKATTNKARTDLENQRVKSIKDVEGVRDVMRGTYISPRDFNNQFARGAAVVRNWNYMTLLGGMTVSAFPDIANKVLSNGFSGIARDLIVPALTDLKKLKLAVKESRDFGVAVEMTLNQRVAAIADIGDPYGKGTSFERTIDAVGNRFSKYTGMQLWNDVMKSADYIMAQNRAIRILQSSKPSKKDTRWLAWAGVGLDDADGMATRIKRQLDKYGSTEGNMRLGNAEKWDDREAQRIFKGVMAKEAATVTVTPGAGDKLLAANSHIGKTLLQFKAFAFAANQRVMIRAMQQGRELDASVASYIVSAISLGMLVYWLKMENSLREASDDPATIIREGVDRSGMMPLIFEAFNTTEKLTGQTFVGESPASRYASRGAFAALLGPSVGKGEDMANLIRNFSDGELKDKDIHAIRKLLPFNNLAWTRRILDQFEMDVIEATGAEQTTFSQTRKAALEGAD